MMRSGNDVYFIFRNPIMESLMDNECIEKALNGTELVPEYYLELGDSMCGDWPRVTVVSVSESRLAPHNPS